MKNSNPKWQLNNIQIFLDDKFIIIRDYNQYERTVKLDNIDLDNFIQMLRESGEVDFPLWTDHGNIMIYNKNKKEVIEMLNRHSEVLELIS